MAYWGVYNGFCGVLVARVAPHDGSFLWDRIIMTTSTRRTREPQYQVELEMADQHGFARFGMMSNHTWREDPRRLLFVLSRYKFVAKMLSGCERVLEVGCADAFGTRIVQQEVCTIVATDFDPVFIEDARERMKRDQWDADCRVHDMLSGGILENFDGAYALDVLEHIAAEDEGRFVGNIAASVREQGVVVIGSPSLQSQFYASPGSKAGHINCKDGQGLKRLMKEHFHNVFLFSMNDEVIHTGFYPMAHYLLALCVDPRRQS